MANYGNKFINHNGKFLSLMGNIILIIEIFCCYVINVVIVYELCCIKLNRKIFALGTKRKKMKTFN